MKWNILIDGVIFWVIRRLEGSRTTIPSSTVALSNLINQRCLLFDMIYLVSLASPSHSLALKGLGLLQVLVRVPWHDELHVEASDHMDHPPVTTQLMLFIGSV